MNWTPVVTNSDFNDARLIQFTAPNNTNNFYRSKRSFGSVPVALAAGAVGNIFFNGDVIATDSYNSHDTNLSTLGQYDSTKTSTNGSIASQQGLVELAYDTIKGNLYLGSNATNSGSGTVTGQVFTNFNVQFPDVTLPPGASSWPTATTTNISGTKTYDFQTSGNYIVNQNDPIIVEAGVAVNLNVTSGGFSPSSLQIHGGATNSGTAHIYLNGPTALFLTANTASDASNRPENLWYFGLPTLTSITFSSIGTFVGVIYAPEANITLTGGGTGNGIVGSCITGTLTLNPHIAFHFDESLVNFWPYF